MTGAVWSCRDHEVEVGRRTLLMGVVNVTPDSFSDGGSFLDPNAAIEHGLRLVADGADILDVGGESTRPGSDPVPADEEAGRVIPVIGALVERTAVPISVDTRKAAVARGAVDAGAAIVNDVTAGADPEMFAVVRDAGAGLVLMHMKGEPKTMQDEPTYHDVVAEVRGFLGARVDAAVAAGIGRGRLSIDPGIGFGKTLEHNLALLRDLARLRDLGVPVLVGPSRKRFIGALTGAEADDRLEGTAGAVAWCAAQRADVVRVHDVREMSRVVRVVDAIVRGTAR
ncbi:MAG TPA: dihydropteroate synthase [Actinomycetota bacterium]